MTVLEQLKQQLFQHMKDSNREDEQTALSGVITLIDVVYKEKEKEQIIEAHKDSITQELLVNHRVIPESVKNNIQVDAEKYYESINR